MFERCLLFGLSATVKYFKVFLIKLQWVIFITRRWSRGPSWLLLMKLKKEVLRNVDTQPGVIQIDCLTNAYCSVATRAFSSVPGSVSDSLLTGKRWDQNFGAWNEWPSLRGDSFKTKIREMLFSKFSQDTCILKYHYFRLNQLQETGLRATDGGMGTIHTNPRLRASMAKESNTSAQTKREKFEERVIEQFLARIPQVTQRKRNSLFDSVHSWQRHVPTVWPNVKLGIEEAPEKYKWSLVGTKQIIWWEMKDNQQSLRTKNHKQRSWLRYGRVMPVESDRIFERSSWITRGLVILILTYQTLGSCHHGRRDWKISVDLPM